MIHSGRMKRHGRLMALCALMLTAGFGIERLDPFPEDRYRVQPSPQTLPSTRQVPPLAVVEGTELVSIAIDHDDLSHPDYGLLKHPTSRGREWERPAYMSFFADGRLQLATTVGLRMHGGASRVYSRTKSFRVYFRPSYGPPAIPATVFFPAGPRNDVTRVILHNDVRTDQQKRKWQLVNPLAYDIAARLGGIVPRTRPARFYLNGEPQGLYVITEHISDEFLEGRFGHRNFSLDDETYRNELFEWARTTRPLRMEDAEARVDLDNLTSWALTILFCATTDVMTQSPMVHDRRDPDGRVFWITWDLDHSFMDLYNRVPEPWLLDSYQTILYNRELRSWILTRLLARDEPYRQYFARRLAAALNHQLNPVFLQERFGHYREVALRRGVGDEQYLAALERFLQERPRALWDLTVKHLKTEPPVTVEVTAPAGAVVTIDGFRTSLPYSGKYLPGTQFDLHADEAGAPNGWVVNGRVERSTRLSFPVSVPVKIRALQSAE